MRVIEQILDLARWAPSGDNTQPWRFEIRTDFEILVHGYDTRRAVVYDLDGWASQVSHGALLETLSLAATRFGYRARSSIASEDEVGHIVYRVTLEGDPTLIEAPLASAIRERVVQRRPMRPTPMSIDQKRALECAVEPFSVVWLDSWRDRWRMAAIYARNAHIRLTIPEAYSVHKAVIAWNCTTSDDRLPAASLGADPLLLGVMRWAMSSWERVSFFNRYLGGTLLPRFVMDFLPGLLCSAHFALVAPGKPQSAADRVAAGRAVQRFWLAATQQNLQVQPAYTPLVFARYARERRRFTGVQRADATAREIARRLNDLLGTDEVAQTMFLGRIGPARAVKGRSLRLPLNRLIVDEAPRHI
ncbi:MAG: molybdopterin biosynthesis protein MoeY [Casimicrobiaceae bacterium]